MAPLFGIFSSTVIIAATPARAPTVARRSKYARAVTDGNHYPEFNRSYGWVPTTAGCSVAVVSTATVHLPRKGWAQVRGGVIPNSWSQNLKRSSRRKMKNTAFHWAVVTFKGKKKLYGGI